MAILRKKISETDDVPNHRRENAAGIFRSLYKNFIDIVRAAIILDVDDPGLARAQFRSFAKQMPLLYCILIFNTIAIISVYYEYKYFFETLIFPLIMCLIASLRAHWWQNQKDDSLFSDAQIATYIKRTCNLAVIMTLGFELWCMWIYPRGDAFNKGHLTFFLALTSVSTVFCLMSMRAAAMRVAASSAIAFICYFSWVDDQRMLVEAIVLGFVAIGMMVVTDRYNHDFSALVQSQRDLQKRQIEAEKLSEQNQHIALTDALSGLQNRRKFLIDLDNLDKNIELDTLAVIFIDLDGFKDANDLHGHQAGDELIVILSKRLNMICPDYAKLSRVGGDEFTFLIETENVTNHAIELAKYIEEQICLPVRFDGHFIQLGASIGISSNADEHLTPQELLRRADISMYQMKMKGKGGSIIYDSIFDKGRIERLKIEEQIGIGLVNNEFDVVYQPIVDSRSGDILGAEALVRWPRRSEGELFPNDFIEIAEATGQIYPLGLFVLETACLNFAPLGDLQLSVNVSPAQFRDPGFENSVKQIVEKTNFPPERLQLEFTEGYLLADPQRAIRAIQAFKAMGMSIALDDFGTGFTSIHYLQSYGFSHIKLDKSLLEGLGSDSRASLLITGATYLANGLDMIVVAEGVETEDQANLLRAAGCHKLQGFLYGKPMPLNDLISAYWSNSLNERETGHLKHIFANPRHGSIRLARGG